MKTFWSCLRLWEDKIVRSNLRKKDTKTDTCLNWTFSINVSIDICWKVNSTCLVVRISRFFQSIVWNCFDCAISVTGLVVLTVKIEEQRLRSSFGLRQLKSSDLAIVIWDSLLYCHPISLSDEHHEVEKNVWWATGYPEMINVAIANSETVKKTMGLNIEFSWLFEL